MGKPVMSLHLRTQRNKVAVYGGSANLLERGGFSDGYILRSHTSTSSSIVPMLGSAWKDLYW